MSGFLTSEAVAERLLSLLKSIPPSVRLIAVTKQVAVEAMRAAYEAGVRDFAESRVQEAAEKQAQLSDLTDITWHMIGRLQSNKAAKAIELFQWIHSVDSLKLAQRLNQLAGTIDRKPNVLLQVKILPDPTKTGWEISQLIEALPLLDQCTHLNIVGLMSIPPYGLDPSTTLSVFTKTRELADQIRQQQWSTIQMDQLSMGMSNDYSLAIEAGSTMIRLGRTLFGERQ